MHFKNVFNINFINQSYRKHETFFFALVLPCEF